MFCHFGSHTNSYCSRIALTHLFWCTNAVLFALSSLFFFSTHTSFPSAYTGFLRPTHVVDGWCEAGHQTWLRHTRKVSPLTDGNLLLMFTLPFKPRLTVAKIRIIFPCNKFCKHTGSRVQCRAIPNTRNEQACTEFQVSCLATLSGDDAKLDFNWHTTTY